MKTKICTKCGKKKDINDFSKHRIMLDGLNCQCKECNIRAVRKWRESNREKVREINNRSRKNNPEKVRESKRKWWRNNPEKISFYHKKRRAFRMNVEGSHTLGEWELLKKQYGYTCPCCKRTEPEIKLTEDHIVPLIKGGSDYIENIQPLCKSCNSRKYTKVIKYEKRILPNAHSLYNTT